MDQSVFDGLIAAARADPDAYLTDFFDNFYNVDAAAAFGRYRLTGCTSLGGGSGNAPKTAR